MSEPTKEQVERAVSVILEVLGSPETDLHKEALSEFKKGNHQAVKRLALENLPDYYCKALGYLGGALKLTPNTDTILAESARAVAEFVKDQTLDELGVAISGALRDHKHN